MQGKKNERKNERVKNKKEMIKINKTKKETKQK